MGPSADTAYTTGEKIGPFVHVLGPGLLELRAHRVTDEMMDEHEQVFGRFLAQNTRPLATLTTPGALLTLTSTQRRRVAAMEKKFAEQSRRYLVGAALLAPNSIVRGLATAVFWLHPPVYPYRFVANREEGLEWLAAQLEAHRSAP